MVPGAEGDTDVDPETGAAAPVARKTLETLGAADAVVEALEMAAHERQRRHTWEADAAAGRADGAFAPNPLMLGLGPAGFVQRSLAQVRPSELEACILCLPFSAALQLLGYLRAFLGDVPDAGAGAGGADGLDLALRVAPLLLRLHQAQLVASPQARVVLSELQGPLRAAAQNLKDTAGFNVAALGHLKRQMELHGTGMMEVEALADGGEGLKSAVKRARRGTEAVIV